MFSNTFITALVAGLAAFATAQDLFDPTSNPTKTPSKNEVVAAGRPYTIAWTPTTTGPVSIQLLGGATQNGLQPGAFVAQHIANTGSVTWTPTNDLVSFAVVGYKIIDVATGKFQYSVPFQVGPGAKDAAGPSAYADSLPLTSATPDYTTPGYATYTEATSTHSPTYHQHEPSAVSYPTYVPVSSIPSHNTTVPKPTGALSVPTSLYTTAVASASGFVPAYPTEFPGSASVRKAGLGLAGAIAGFVLLL